MRFSFLPALGLTLTCFFANNLTASAEGDNTARATSAPVLVELFTSQSCSSCPPAEQLFNEFADEPGVVAIQWHVDYWDNLIHGQAGKWKDPYSSDDYTQRQRDYNYALRGMGSVYTPQAVIGGVTETIGSRASSVRHMIEAAPAAQVTIDIASNETGYSVQISPRNDARAVQAETMLITLLKSEGTDILGGENKGLSVLSRNIAVATDMLGPWTGTQEMYRTSTAQKSEEYTCAVIVQEKGKGRILGASYCPG